VPPLRERGEDIPAPGAQFVTFFARRHAGVSRGCHARLSTCCCPYPWPGNVRELRNAIEHAVLMWPASTIEPRHCPSVSCADASSDRGVGDDVSLERSSESTSCACWRAKATLEDAAASLASTPPLSGASARSTAV